MGTRVRGGASSSRRDRQRLLIIGSLLGCPVLLAVAWFAAREAAESTGAEDASQKAAQTTPSTEAPATAGEPPESAIAELPPGRSAEPEAALEEQRTQIALFGTAKVTAVYAGHDVEGVRVDRVDPTSFWGLVGVRSGDTVIAHNGAPIDDAAAMVGLLNAMEGDAVIRLRVRGAQGDERTLYYSEPR